MEYGILITKEIRKMIQIKFIFIKYRKVHLIIIIKLILLVLINNLINIYSCNKKKKKKKKKNRKRLITVGLMIYNIIMN